MKRYATIAAVWLLPPLLFWLGATINPWPVWLDGKSFFYECGLASSIAALTGALLAFHDKRVFWLLYSKSADAVTARRSIGVGASVLAALTICILMASQMGYGFSYIRFFVSLAYQAISILLVSMPLWSAILLWRPDTRIASIRFVTIVATCTLPLAWLMATQYHLTRYYDARYGPHGEKYNMGPMF